VVLHPFGLHHGLPLFRVQVRQFFGQTAAYNSALYLLRLKKLLKSWKKIGFICYSASTSWINARNAVISDTFMHPHQRESHHHSLCLGLIVTYCYCYHFCVFIYNARKVYFRSMQSLRITVERTSSHFWEIAVLWFATTWFVCTKQLTHANQLQKPTLRRVEYIRTVAGSILRLLVVVVTLGAGEFGKRRVPWAGLAIRRTICT